MWEEFNTGLRDNITDVMKIIDDALCYCFEFKVENHKLYFREIQQKTFLYHKRHEIIFQQILKLNIDNVTIIWYHVRVVKITLQNRTNPIV